jgi:hypothetical protein
MSSGTKALDDWLRVATRGMSERSTTRIAEEIREHYLASLDSGLGPDAAVERLGDPATARRAFRRAYLTSFQEKLVKDYRGRPPAWRLAIYVLLFLLAVGVAVWGPRTAAQRAIGAALVVWMLAALACAGFVVGRLYERGRERVAILLGALGDFALYVGLIVGSRFVIGNASAAITGFFGGIFVLLLALYLPLVRKLRNDPHRAV